MAILKNFLKSSIITLVFLAILLASAGIVGYWQAWIYTGVSLLINLATQFVLRGNPELSNEPSRPGNGSQKWDKALLGIGLLLTIITLVVAGLDTGRNHWSPNFTWSWSLAGAALMIFGSGLFLRSMKENKFFSAVVRIQDERGHSVCMTGPYSVVRHPGYTSMIIGTLGLPLVFLSIWSVIPTILSVILLIVRTIKEDHFLGVELRGYHDYQEETRWLLIPGIW